MAQSKAVPVHNCTMIIKAYFMLLLLVTSEVCQEPFLGGDYAIATHPVALTIVVLGFQVTEQRGCAYTTPWDIDAVLFLRTHASSP